VFVGLNGKKNIRLNSMKKIIGYIHNYLINHWSDIVQEQIKKLVDSGLYEASEAIYCGVIGTNDNFQKFMQLIKKYPKIQVAEYSTTPELYEFQTLDVLKTHADQSTEDYYLYYIHGKGVSYGIDHENKKAYSGGTYWRRHMEKWTIEKWKENVAMLDMGYETCGTQMRVRDWPRHYSGSFLWARSEYIKILHPIQQLDLTDRIQSEFYILSATPIAATLSQEYVDYYTPENPTDKLEIFKPHPHNTAPTLRKPSANQPVLKPRSLGASNDGTKKEKSGRVVVHTLAWNVTSEVERATRSLYELNDRNTFEHIICDLNFPLIKPDEIPMDVPKAIKANSKELQAIAKQYGSKYVQMKNVGISQNWSTIFLEEGLGDGDVIIGCDPDEVIHPTARNWVGSIADVLRSDEKYGVASLVMQEQIPTLNETNSIERNIEGHDIIEVHGGAMWGIIGCSGSLLKKIGGVPYPTQHEIYGGLESALIAKMDEFGYKWCFMKDKLFTHPEWDFTHLLRCWKHHALDSKNGKQIHFEHYLRLKQLGKV
jgi:hypothetical protein